MSVLEDARAHLAKAKEFLEAAELSLDAALFNAATSDAVVSAINSKDAICLKLTGQSMKLDDHNAAPAELRRAGKAGAGLEATFKRLLNLRARSQYQVLSVQRRHAKDAVAWAERMYDGARSVLDS
ncbi:MAG: HEPN domain-containing protein [Acidimicrobiia bacterium]|nr:HEPN domain-containing protein [Acidimicrobiia bacterium]